MIPAVAPKPGELWEFPVATDGLVGWVVVKYHPDDASLQLMVPADSETLVGPLDVAVALGQVDTLDFQRIVLRGTFACWVATSDCWFRATGANVAHAWRTELCERLLDKDLASAPALSGEALAFESGVLVPAAQALESWGERVKKTLRLDPAGPLDLEPEIEAGPGLLAAAGTSVLDEILADSVSVEESPSSTLEILYGLRDVFTGRTARLRVSADEVQLEACGEGLPPSCLLLGPNGGRIFLRWVRHINGFWRSQPAQLDELAAPPLRLVVIGDIFMDIKLDFECPGTE